MFLCIGQSNMAGRAMPAESDTGELNGVWLLDGNGLWVPARHPYNEFSTVRKGIGLQGISPAFGFAKRMREGFPERAIGLVVNAKGWTSAAEWQPEGQLFQEAVRRTKEALKSGGTLSGILWIQGETDLAQGKEADYLPNLERMIAAFREEFGEVAFVAGEISGENPINDGLAMLPGRISLSAVASSDDLRKFDHWHYDGQSAETLGQRMATKMINLLEGMATSSSPSE